MSFVIRALDPRDWPALSEVLAQSFNVPLDGWSVFRERLGDENVRVVLDDSGRIVGGCGVYQMGQVWQGRSVPLGGVAGVGVAPEARGQGVAKAMMADVLRWLHERAVPMAGLYPASLRVYRSVGYEQSGERVRYEVPLASLSGFHSEVAVVPVDPADPQARAHFVQRSRPVHGNLDRNEAIWKRITMGLGVKRYAWLLGEDGYAVIQHQPHEGMPWNVELGDHRVPDAPTARTLLALLAGHRSMAKHVRWFGSPADPLLHFVPEPVWTVTEHQRWMLRLVDVAAALRGRGWPPGVAGELHLRVTDELLPHNAGNFRIEVADGQAHVSEGGRGEVLVGPRALGPLYSAFHTATQLAALGLLTGPAAALATADRLFAAPTPWMREMY